MAASTSYSHKQITYSKQWAKVNEALFAQMLLETMEQHPEEFWMFELFHSKDFIVVELTLK